MLHTSDPGTVPQHTYRRYSCRLCFNLRGHEGRWVSLGSASPSALPNFTLLANSCSTTGIGRARSTPYRVVPLTGPTGMSQCPCPALAARSVQPDGRLPRPAAARTHVRTTAVAQTQSSLPYGGTRNSTARQQRVRTHPLNIWLSVKPPSSIWAFVLRRYSLAAGSWRKCYRVGKQPRA